ncbi:MAG: cysteine hydrolase [Candidatus Methanoplasma sp.]|jgi:nicotinamidase-related amidase|nr:cysteine hydrolase [Candidatus Methanoplasma sp.]
MSHQTPDKRGRKIALVVIDVQRKFTGSYIREESCGREIDVINKAASMFREHGRPVVFVRFEGESHCDFEGADGDEYLHGIVTDPSDITVRKAHMNAFLGSRLADVVKGCGCDGVLLAGMITHCCVMGTYYGAGERGLGAYLLAGGTIAPDDSYNDASRVVCRTYSLADAEENLRATRVDVPAGMFGTDHPCDP